MLAKTKEKISKNFLETSIFDVNHWNTICSCDRCNNRSKNNSKLITALFKQCSNCLDPLLLTIDRSVKPIGNIKAIIGLC